MTAGKRDAVVVLGGQGGARAGRLRRRPPLPSGRHSLVGSARAGLRAGAGGRLRPSEPGRRQRFGGDGGGADGARGARRAGGIAARRRGWAGSPAPSSTITSPSSPTERDEHWREVNLAAGASVANADWPRLPAAQGWIDEHKTSVELVAGRVSGVGESGRSQRRSESRRFRPALRRPDALAQPDAIEEDAPCPSYGKSLRA